MIDIIKIPQIVCVGSAGAATSNQTTTAPVNGELLSVYIDYSASSAATTVVVLTTASGPTITLYTAPAGKTDGMVHPRVGTVGITGTALTYDGTRTVNEPWAISAYVKATATLNDDAQTVDVYLIVRR